MAGWRRAVELAMSDEEIERLTALSRSRTEPASRVSRAQMLLAYRENPSFCSGVLSLRHFSGWFSLSLGAWVPKNLARRSGSGRLDLDLWFRPARCCSTGSGRLDLDLLISGPRV